MRLLVMRSGSARLGTPAGYEEDLAAGSHLGATVLTGGAHVQFLDQAEAYRLSLESVAGLPIVGWKLLEMHRRRYAAD